MTESSMSEAEKLYVIHGVEDECRVDGRKCLEGRQMKMERGVVPTCHGSAHIRIGKTDLLIGVKIQIEEPEDDKPDEGRFEFSADCSANASPLFEGRGGEEMVLELISVLEESFLPSLNTKMLCINPGKTVWVVYVDILILEFGSKATLFDASGVGVTAALSDTRIPKVTFDLESEELDLAEDPSDVERIDTSRLPVLVCLTKIGNNYVIDATEYEEAASVSSVVLAFDAEGHVIHSRKIGTGALFVDPLTENLTLARKIAMDLHHDLSTCDILAEK